MHVPGNSALTMLQSHVKAAPDSAIVRNERVRLSRLGTIARDYLQPSTVPFLKVDTQGYEDRVPDGAPDSCDRVSGLQLELRQQLFDALVERLRALGFSIWVISPGFHDHDSGRMLQVDATFFCD
jgi:hypothetical protein